MKKIYGSQPGAKCKSLSDELAMYSKNFHITCSSCQFSQMVLHESQSNLAYCTDLYRNSSGNQFPVLKSLGYCLSCSCFTDIEYLPKLKTIQNKIKHLKKKLFWRSCFKLITKSYFPVRDIEKRLSYESKLLDMQMNRKFLPRCLACGSENVKSVISACQMGKLSDSHTLFQTDVAHPTCGGYFLIEEVEAAYYNSNKLHDYTCPEGWNISWAPRTKFRIYNTEGNYVDTACYFFGNEFDSNFCDYSSYDA
jgi:hypothetical protein